MPLHVAGSPHMAGIHASFDPNFAVPDMRRMGVIEVPVKTLDEILIDVKAPAPIDFVSIDVSFISLKLILPAVATFARGDVVALIKPQFEVGKRDVGKGGIVRDDAKRAAAVESVVAFAREIGFEVKGVIESPIKGAEGNVEYLMSADTRAAPPATTPA